MSFVVLIFIKTPFNTQKDIFSRITAGQVFQYPSSDWFGIIWLDSLLLSFQDCLKRGQKV